MKPMAFSSYFGWILGLLVIAACPGICATAEKGDSKPKATSSPSQSKTEPTKSQQPTPATKSDSKPKSEPAAKPPEEKTSDDEDARKPVDLGPPLVDRPNDLKRLDPTDPVWIDPVQKQVIFQGEACKPNYGLEFLVTFPDRDYEAVISSKVMPSVVHAGLLAVGAEPGHTARFQPEFAPPTGTEIEIELRWKDKAGKVQKAPAQQWIRNVKTKQPLDVNWVFAGSGVFENEATKKMIYEGDSGDFISVLNLPTSTLDLPIRSTGALETRIFEGNTDKMPPKGTPVTLILKPKLDKTK
jgi:hypothetical protein